MDDSIDRIRTEWARMRPGLDTAPIAVLGRVLLAAKTVQERADQNLADAGVSRAEFDLLSQLRRSQAPLRPGDLTRGIVGSPAATTKRLHRLAEAELVVRSADPDDGRASRVSLTDAGRELIDRVLPAQLAEEAQLLAGLPPARQRELADLLRELLISWGL
ncbi:MarR family transcriptional regulator [Microbacterium horticulturae]|uniref:MarR family transcriptional regulator n=1 Tax=Microbacterium horticulturae TaxID=3028316 RepID=A0ABY8C4D5_9MICO|nr:MarR family transcriptional regulator [Microbacterium sp. KACC 23027]WEG10192.1 MarR family transcriptional regulator [Microbacterium sp. KACC 23027]